MDRTSRSPPAPCADSLHRFGDRVAGDHWFDPHEAHSVESHQAGRSAQPQIAVRAAQNLVDGLAGEAVLRGPYVMAVLIDLQRWIKGHGAARRAQGQCQERTCAHV